MHRRLSGVGVEGAKGVPFLSSQIHVLHVELNNHSVRFEAAGLSRAFWALWAVFGRLLYRFVSALKSRFSRFISLPSADALGTDALSLLRRRMGRICFAE
jgi:hypothetical protein